MIREINRSFWEDRRVLVTGGASFIGSHLVDKLAELGVQITVVDNLSSGRIENLKEALRTGRVKLVKKDLEWVPRYEGIKIFKDHSIVFHLAAIHGGRGFIHTHPADVCSNLVIDHKVLELSLLTDVEKVVYASSACVYPPKLQKEIGSKRLLSEQDSDPWKINDYLSADEEYGWCKLMGEVQLIAFYKQYGLKGVPLRFVTVYGPRENETHAIIALIYKAYERMDPYVVWGSGEQERDFTYVSDIVDGMLLAAEKIDKPIPINLGTGIKYKIKDVVEMIFKIMNWRPRKIIYDTSKPVGVLSRGLDITRARELLDYEPKVTLEEGLRRTIEWYIRTHKRTGKVDERKLFERHV